MSAEPRNAASEMVRSRLPLLGDPAAVRLLADELSDDFSAEDRRRLIGLPRIGRDDWAEAVNSWSELGAGRGRSSLAQVIAVRGERLVLFRARATYPDGREVESLGLAQFDELVQRLQRSMQFDPDDVDAALSELDSMCLALDDE